MPNKDHSDICIPGVVEAVGDDTLPAAAGSPATVRAGYEEIVIVKLGPSREPGVWE